MRAESVLGLCGCQILLGKVTLDEQGFVICPTHKARRYGWRDANGRNHSLDGFTDLQIERWQLFGEKPVPDTFTPFPVKEDRRDNRDPKYVTPASGYEDSYEMNEALEEISSQREEASLQARVRLDLRDKRDVPIHDGRPLEIWDAVS